ncbi:MAG: NlpC/P60 family protein [Ruminococcaceae bacterium]|nr:NlpC/P60 family protein [Oscillospiraceae bacterium]
MAHHFAGRAVKPLVMLFVTIALLTVFAFAAQPPLTTAAGITTGSSLRLREAPSTSSGIVTHLDKNVYTAVLGKSGDWYHISVGGKTGYVSSAYLRLDEDGIFETAGRVNASCVPVRSGASVDAPMLALLNTGTEVTITGLTNGWYAVTCRYGTKGYIRSDFLDMTGTRSSTSGSGIAATARSYLGVRYVWGGASPSGFDCSGFTQYVYRRHGYSLSHSASAQWLYGPGSKVWSIGALQSGDLVFFNDPSRNNGKACSHAGIYIGNGQFIHASSAKEGVIVSSLTSGYYNRYFIGGRHV